MLIDEFVELSKLNEAIDTLLSNLTQEEPTSDDYQKLADQLTKLIKIKQIIVETKLKDFAAEGDAKEFEVTHHLKNTEVSHKYAALEHSAQAEQNALELKRLELQQRQVEHEETFALKKREIDIKQLDAEKPDRMSKDALVAAGTSIAGILLIIGYEKANVIASKALSFVFKR